MKVGFTGTRKGLSEHQMELLRQFFKENEISDIWDVTTPLEVTVLFEKLFSSIFILF